MAINGVGENVHCCLVFFYADYGTVVSRYSDWLQYYMNVLISLFWRYGLKANIAKSHTMTCQNGKLRSGMSEEAGERKYTGVGDYYRKRLRKRITCPEFGFKITTGSMIAHRSRMHGVEPEIDWNRVPASQTEHHPQVYDVSFPRTEKQCPRPFPECLGYSRTCTNLQNNFRSQQWGDIIRILEEHPTPFPKCER